MHRMLREAHLHDHGGVCHGLLACEGLGAAEHSKHLDALEEVAASALLGKGGSIDGAQALAGRVLGTAGSVTLGSLHAHLTGTNPRLAGLISNLVSILGEALHESLLVGADGGRILAAGLEEGADGAGLAGLDGTCSSSISGSLGGLDLSGLGLLGAGNARNQDEGHHRDDDEALEHGGHLVWVFRVILRIQIMSRGGKIW
jgi:hypothetical protein